MEFYAACTLTSGAVIDSKACAACRVAYIVAKSDLRNPGSGCSGGNVGSRYLVIMISPMGCDRRAGDGRLLAFLLGRLEALDRIDHGASNNSD